MVTFTKGLWVTVEGSHVPVIPRVKNRTYNQKRSSRHRGKKQPYKHTKQLRIWISFSQHFALYELFVCSRCKCRYCDKKRKKHLMMWRLGILVPLSKKTTATAALPTALHVVSTPILHADCMVKVEYISLRLVWMHMYSTESTCWSGLGW